MRRLSRNIVVWILGGLAGCISASSGKPDTGSVSRTELLYVISGGWHTEIGLPVGTIVGPLAALKAEFPGARYLVFGWGGVENRVALVGQNVDTVDPLHAALSLSRDCFALLAMTTVRHVIARSAATKQSRWARDCFALLAMTTKKGMSLRVYHRPAADPRWMKPAGRPAAAL